MTAQLEWVKPDSVYPEDCPRCWLPTDPWKAVGPRTTARCRPCGFRWKPGLRVQVPRHIRRMMWRLTHQNISADKPLRGW